MATAQRSDPRARLAGTVWSRMRSHGGSGVVVLALLLIEKTNGWVTNMALLGVLLMAFVVAAVSLPLMVLSGGA